MPELPEVETIRRQLQKKIVGRTIKFVEVLYPKVVHQMSTTDFIATLKGRQVREVGLQGKLILIRLSGNETLVVHLKMTGRLFFDTIKDSPSQLKRTVLDRTKFTEVILTFTDNMVLRYDDLRRFGYMKILPTSEEAKLVHTEEMGIDFFDHTL